MKKKVVLALVAALTLTVGSLGTVFAMHDHVWNEEQWIVDKEEIRGDKWVVDKEAVYETVHHPAETHEEEQWVVDKEAWTETIKHPAETHEEQQWVVDQEAWDEQKIVGYHTICNICGEEYTNSNDHYLTYGCKSTSYTGNVPIYDTIHHDEVGHWETVTIIDKEAWTETIEHEEEGHWETVTVTDKEAWDEEVLVSPEEGHWEYDVVLIPESGHWEHTCTECGEIQNSETGEVIKPGESIDPEEPENPDSDGSNGDQTEIPSKDNSQATDQNDQKTEESGKQETAETDKAQNSNNASSTTEEKDATASTVSDENEIPQTGDPSSLIYLATLAGSAVTGGTAFGLRRKFKK